MTTQAFGGRTSLEYRRWPTGATAGTPGAFTPAPYTVPNPGYLVRGEPEPIVASPATAWTTGQRVRCDDGSEAYWTGSAWVPGRAP